MQLKMLDKNQHERYERQLLINNFDAEDQEKLIRASVLVIGAGGLGAPVLHYLCAAGVGNIGIVDFDTVTLSNLQRQVLFTSDTIGQSKSELAKARLEALNPDCKLVAIKDKWDSNTAQKIAPAYDLIVDCTDNIPARLVTDKITKQLKIPFVFGAIDAWEGQVSVFNHKDAGSFQEFLGLDEASIPEKKNPIGVIGVTPAVIGSMQASEAIKIIIDKGELLTGKIVHISLLSNRWECFDL